ncbi:MAG: hypothetical protein KDE26_05810 [Bacteroidetes bacterium]|nr:hypothetical protein [Bacteroidota bacterium]
MNTFGKIILLLFLFPCMLLAQETRWSQKLDDYKIKVSANVQLWGTYTFGQEIYNDSNGAYQPVDDRLNLQLRRSRLSFKGQPYENLKFNMTAALDLVGKDDLAATQGASNNGGSPKFRLWNAYVQWRVKSNNEKVNIVAGYFPVQIGRESITSAFRSTSMEKSWSQNYLRRHLTGIGPGRAMGVNIGGLFLHEKISWGYDLGIYNPVFQGIGSYSTGAKYSPLLVGRITGYFGDPESKEYTINHKINYFGKRKGLSLALAGAYQGETDLFISNSVLGMDVLLNWKNFNLDGEWSLLWREGMQTKNLPNEEYFTVASQTGYLRMSYNINLKNGYVIEPVAMVMHFGGPMDKDTQAEAASVKFFAGEDQMANLGFNFYLNPDLKLSLHYTMNQGDSGAAGNGAVFNNYFFQSGVGAIRRGDWLGFGLVAGF